MAFRLSTGARKALLGNIVIRGATYSYSDNGGSSDTITSSASDFITKGFFPGMTITTTGSTTAGNNVTATLTAVVAATLTFATGTLSASEAFAAATQGVGNNGGGYKDFLNLGMIRIYTGSQPATADDAETGTLLVSITDASGTFTAVTGTNGLYLDMQTDASDYTYTTLAKKSSQTWSGAAVASGTAGWFRFYDKHQITGASYTSRRIDGSCATSGGQFTLSTTSVVSGATITVDTFNIKMPYA